MKPYRMEIELPRSASTLPCEGIDPSRFKKVGAMLSQKGQMHPEWPELLQAAATLARLNASEPHVQLEDGLEKGAEGTREYADAAARSAVLMALRIVRTLVQLGKKASQLTDSEILNVCLVCGVEMKVQGHITMTKRPCRVLNVPGKADYVVEQILDHPLASE